MQRRAFLTIALLAAPGLAFGQAHKHAHKAPNGGQIVHIGSYEAEMVVRGPEISVYITDEKDQKVDASRFSGTAVVLARGNKQRTVDLSPAGDNRLAGKFDFAVDGRFRANLTLRGPSGEIGKGRYNVDVK